MFRHLSRRLFLIAAAAVVFITTYALILPAITIDANTAAITPGFDLSSGTKAETVVEQQSDCEAEVPDIPDLDGTITALPDEDINQPSSNRMMNSPKRRLPKKQLPKRRLPKKQLPKKQLLKRQPPVRKNLPILRLKVSCLPKNSSPRSYSILTRRVR